MEILRAVRPSDGGPRNPRLVWCGAPQVSGLALRETYIATVFTDGTVSSIFRPRLDNTGLVEARTGFDFSAARSSDHRALASAIRIARALGKIAVQPAILGENGRPHLEDGFRTRRPIPILVPTLHSAVELADQRLDPTAGYRQPWPTITRIVHPTAVVLHVTHHLRQHLPGVALVPLLRGRRPTQPLLTSCQLRQHFGRSSLPARCHPELELPPASGLVRTHHLSRSIQVAQHVQEIRAGHKVREPGPLDLPVVLLPVPPNACRGAS